MMNTKMFNDFLLNMYLLDVEQYNRLVGQLKVTRTTVGVKTKETLMVGDRVNIAGGKRIKDEKGTIKKINRTRAIVTIDGRGDWNIPFAYITKI
jgi:hypothetical protein